MIAYYQRSLPYGAKQYIVGNDEPQTILKELISVGKPTTINEIASKNASFNKRDLIKALMRLKEYGVVKKAETRLFWQIACDYEETLKFLLYGEGL